jgi:predicted metal-dependent enzyme (double-stranded beta helix superfamily)
MREAMQRLIATIDGANDDVLAVEKEIVGVMQDILAIPGLDTMIANPTAFDADPRRPSTGWLYYDGEYRVVRGHMPGGFVQKPHNHGAWNILAVYRGAMQYRSYRRLDDGTRPYHAELEVAEDRIMLDGDVTVMPGPPHDIHMNAGLAANTVSLLVARQHFNAEREQYLPELNAYYVIDAETAATR